MEDKTQKKPERAAIAGKKKQVAGIAAKVKSAKVLGLINLSKLPDRFLQKARKGLRGKVEFIAAKNNIIKKSLETAGKGSSLIPKLNSPSVLLLSSEMTPYAISQFFRDSRGKVAAKPGQIAIEDITVHVGETNLPPGPALSELKGANINAQIKGGKIVIAKDSIVAKKGDKISDMACKALQKLGVLPFEVGVRMDASVDAEGLAFDYDSLDLDSAKVSPEIMRELAQAENGGRNVYAMLLQAISQSQNMALNGNIYSESTVELLIQKAMREALAVGKAEAKPASEKAEAPAEGEKKEGEGETAPAGTESKPENAAPATTEGNAQA